MPPITFTRQILDDYFHPGRVPHCDLEDSASSETERQNWHNANKRFAACAAMYEWLDKQGILKKEAFCYDVIQEQTVNEKLYHKQINFAVDSNNLIKYRDQMLASGVPDAELATSYILAEGENVVSPSRVSGAVCLTWTMHTYRSSHGSVSQSWETPHEHCFYFDDVRGIGKTYDIYHESLTNFHDELISEEEHFENIKKAISHIYYQDRTIYLSKVPAAFVRETQNPDFLIVTLPCDNTKSDDGKLRITVNTSQVFDDAYNKKIISLGDFEKKVKISIKKSNQWQNIYELPIDIKKEWNIKREEYANAFKRSYGAPVTISGIPYNNVEPVENRFSPSTPTSKVILPGMGSVYIESSLLSEGGNTFNIIFESGFDQVRLYTFDENGERITKRMNARELAKQFEEQLSTVLDEQEVMNPPLTR